MLWFNSSFVSYLSGFRFQLSSMKKCLNHYETVAFKTFGANMCVPSTLQLNRHRNVFNVYQMILSVNIFSC